MGEGRPKQRVEWSLLSLLSNKYQELRPAEQRVAKFLLEHGDAYPDFSLAELAELSGSSQSAVVHMCQSIGLEGFRSFRLQWVKEAAARKPSQPHSVVFNSIVRELEQTETLLLPNLKEAADLICQARQVFVFGSGGSGLVAELGAESLAVAGRMAYTFQADKRITSAFFDTSTVLIVLSHKGMNETLEEAMIEAGKLGAKRILVTGAPDSRLARVSDVLLVTSAPGGPSVPLVTSEVRTIQVAAMHALIKVVSTCLNGTAKR